MTGIVLTGTGIALMAGLPAANRAISTHGWRTAYVIVGGVVIVVVVIAAQFLKRDPYKMGRVPYGYDGISTNASARRLTSVLSRGPLHKPGMVISLVYFCTYFIFYALLVHLVIYATGHGISSPQAIRIMAFLGGLASLVGR